MAPSDFSPSTEVFAQSSTLSLSSPIMLDPSALAIPSKQAQKGTKVPPGSLLPDVCTISDIWKASSLVSACILKKLSDPKFDLKPIDAAMKASARAKLDPKQKKSISVNLARLAGVQTYPLRVEEGTFGESIGGFSWPNDGNYISKSWIPSAHHSYLYRNPSAPDYSGEGLNDYAFPDLRETEILKRWPDEAPVSMLWSCGIVRALDTINLTIIEKDEGIHIGNNPVVDKLKGDVGKEAVRLGTGLVKGLLTGGASGESFDSKDAEKLVGELVNAAIAWIQSTVVKEIKQHSTDVQNQKKVLAAASNIYPGKDAFLSEISEEYSFSIGKRKAGSWLSYEKPFTFWGQVATHDTIVGAAAELTGLTSGEYEGVYSGAMMAIFGSFGKLHLSSDDRDSAISKENLEAGKKARDAWSSEIGYWRQYKGKISQYGNAYDNRKPNTKWRV